MSRVHPLKRLQVTAAAMAVLGLALAITAEPLATLAPSANAVALPLVESTAPETTPVAAPRRAWRDQVPAVIVWRRIRPS